MTSNLSPASRGNSFRFALPPSLGAEAAADRAGRLEQFLSNALSRPTKVTVAPNYEALARRLLSGDFDAAWAPPFVCARVEALGTRVVVRSVRSGASTYRAAMLGRRADARALERLRDARALWVDRDSVAGYLLPMSFLRRRGLEPASLFVFQQFSGSYRASIHGVLEGRGDVTSIFAHSADLDDQGLVGVEQIAPGHSADLAVLALTDEAPNDGVAVSPDLPRPEADALERTLLALHESPEGEGLLREIFDAQHFESAPRFGYRTLYRMVAAHL